MASSAEKKFTGRTPFLAHGYQIHVPLVSGYQHLLLLIYVPNKFTQLPDIGRNMLSLYLDIATCSAVSISQ